MMSLNPFLRTFGIEPPAGASAPSVARSYLLTRPKIWGDAAEMRSRRPGYTSVGGQYAYVGLVARLAIYDISTPASPQFVARTESLLGGTEASGDYAYLADRYSGLRVVDIGDSEAVAVSDVDARWRELKPVFVLGMQRSGTSVLAQAILRMGFQGFAEGHLWLDLVMPFEALLDPSYRAPLRHEDYTPVPPGGSDAPVLQSPLGCRGDPVGRPEPADNSRRHVLRKDRSREILKYVAVAIDQFHRDHLPAGFSRWMDKSPGAYAVRNAPVLAVMFPRSQFVFIHRNGIATVHSGKHRWPPTPSSPPGGSPPSSVPQTIIARSLSSSGRSGCCPHYPRSQRATITTRSTGLRRRSVFSSRRARAR